MTIRRYAGRAAIGTLFAFAFLLHGSDARAQRTSGTLQGTVFDNQGHALPGVRVVLTGFGEPFTRFTDAQGRFEFPDVDPGEGSLTASLEGFSTVERPSVSIRTGRTTTLEVSLSPAVDEGITVTAESPILDERKISRGTTVSQIELDKIPTTRDPWAVVTQTPPDPASPDDPYDFALDGLVITDPAAPGAWPTGYDFDAFEEFAVSTGGTDVDLVTGGVTLNLVTRRGANEWRGSARYLLGDVNRLPADFFDDGVGGPDVGIDIGETADGTACLDGFGPLDDDGNPVPGSGTLDPGEGIGAFVDPPPRFRFGDWETRRGRDRGPRIVEFPSCGGEGPSLYGFDFDDPVTSESPLLDERRISSGTTVSRIELEKIPTARDPWAILRSTPGVLVDRINVGGNESGQAPFTGAGHRSGEALFTVDGVVVTDRIPGDLDGDGWIDSDLFRETIGEPGVRTGGVEAEYGGALGGVINVITKSGGNEFSGSLRVDFSYDARAPARDALAGAGSPSVDFTIRDTPEGGLCFGGFRFVDGSGAPIPGLDDLPLDAGLGFAADPPIRLTIGGGWSSLDLDGDGHPDGRFGSIPACDGGPALTFYDRYELLHGDPTHLYVGVDGILPVDLSGILPDTKKERVQTTWNQDGPTDIYKIEDVHVFSSSFFLRGSFVGPGFPREPWHGKGPIGPGDGVGFFGFGTGLEGPAATDGPGGGFAPIDVDGDRIGDTFFIQLHDLQNPCPDLLGGFFTVDGIGAGGGTLTPDPTFGEIPCREYEGVTLTTRRRFSNNWQLYASAVYDDRSRETRTGPPSVGFVPAGSGSVFDADAFTLGGPLVKDRLWIWGSYARMDPSHLLLNGQGATPLDAYRTGLPDGHDPERGSYFLSGNRAPIFESETGTFDWETITPRVGVTYALGEKRRTLLRASYARFAEQIETGFGVGSPDPFAYTFTDPSRPLGDGVLGQGGFLVGGFGLGEPADGGHSTANGENGETGGSFVDFDGDGIAETLLLDFRDFFPNPCPGFDGPIAGFLPGDGGGLRPIRPTPEDCGAFVPSYRDFRNEFGLGTGWYSLSAGPEPEDRRDPQDLRVARYSGVLAPSLFAELQLSEKAFTFGPVLDAPLGRGIQDMGVEFLGGFEGRYAPGGAAPGDGPRSDPLPTAHEGDDDPYPLLHFVALGGSTGDVVDVRIVHPPGERVPIEGFVAIEPVAATASDRERWESEISGLEGETERRTLSAYCLRYAADAPPAGTVFRVAGPDKQAAFAPKARAMEAARRLHEGGLLNPDTDPESYFHSVRQWSLWTQERGFDADGFADAFVEHTKKNVAAAGRAWTGEIEEIVRTSARGRWRDVRRVLEEATP